MGVMDMLFGNSFFQLPFLEAMMWMAVVMSIGAAFVGLWRRLVTPAGQPADRFPSYEAESRTLARAA